MVEGALRNGLHQGKKGRLLDVVHVGECLQQEETLRQGLSLLFSQGLQLQFGLAVGLGEAPVLGGGKNVGLHQLQFKSEHIVNIQSLNLSQALQH